MEETFQRRMKDGASPWWLRKISMDGEGCEAPGWGGAQVRRKRAQAGPERRAAC